MKKKYIDEIFAFYFNEVYSGDFQNSIFKECNPEEMLLRRLQRAVGNEAEGSLLHSRYGIWGSNACDLINKALDAIRRQDNVNAIRLLELTKRSLMAYTDSQAVFDAEEFSFVHINSLFHSYATHLLSMNEDKSEVIDKDEIIQRLKKVSGINGASLPRDIDISIKNGVLRFYVHNTDQNMQVDSAAFEGWILVLKTWLPDIKYVELDFTVPEITVERFGNPQAGHYNRFLYRLNNMLRLFPAWFFVHESKQSLVKEFVYWLESNTCLLNHSLEERKSVIETEKMERQIESWFAFEEGKSLLCNRWSINGDKLFNQLPIGVFHEKIAAPNAIFTRGASAIDLWGVSQDGKDLHLIELKCGNNKSIGVISEILFYIAVLYDTCISDKPLFSFGRYGKSEDTNDMLALKNEGQRFGRLIAHVLAEKFHPLFSSNLEALIAEGLSSLDIGFDRVLYDYSKKVLIT